MASVGPMTIEDVSQLEEDGFLYELIDGELLKVPPTGEEHNFSTIGLIRHLLPYVDRTGIGNLYIATQGFVIRRDPDTLLAPDLAIVTNARLRSPHNQVGYVPESPDFVVEIVSPSDRRGQIDRKVQQYLDADVRLLWLVEPRYRRVTVYRPGWEPEAFTVGDTLEGHDVLPGLEIPVAAIFR